MTDPIRDHARPADHPSGADRRVDALLIEGLESYFEGRFEDAIHLWTRVLFLDRHQASARAYIERARGAIAERQRRADESLQVITTLINDGRVREARAQLTQVISAIGDDERTAALRARLERLERASTGAPRIHAVSQGPTGPAAWWTKGLALASYRIRTRDAVLAAALVALAVVTSSPGVRSWLGVSPARPVPAVSSAPVALPVLSGGEVALTRARALYARGRLAEALHVLDRVGTEQTERSEADRLRVEIQRVLLAGVEGRR